MSYLYSIADADIKGASKDLLGGKGYGLWKMRQSGYPVPLAYILTTNACRAYMKDPAAVMAEVKAKLLPEIVAGLTKEFGYMPLVAVRSGARDSMPGMMDTILNVGIEVPGDDDCIEDCFRRLIEMYAGVVHGIGRETFAGQDSAGRLKFYEAAAREPWPDRTKQLLGAIEAVFKSWNNERAKKYRELNGIEDDLGTAVVVQAMVFGNFSEKSGTGVAFSRNFSTGENTIVGNWLLNGQGEDVVAGIRNVAPLSAMKDDVPEAALELFALIDKLEKEERDMVDVEFTVQDNKLYLLQVRAGKRTSMAAVRIAVDMVDEALITVDQALARVSLREFLGSTRPVIDPAWAAKNPPQALGIPASVGVVSGAVVFSSAAAVEFKGGPCVLIAKETTPDDIAGMHAAVGILTSTGGTTSHAAVVARSMDKVCVVGCTSLHVNAGRGARLGDRIMTTGDKITIDGVSGGIWVNVDVPVVGGASEYIAKFLAMLEAKYPVYRTVTSVGQMAGAEKLLVATYELDRDGDFLQSEFQALLKGIAGREALIDLRGYEAFVRAADAPLEYMFGDRKSVLPTKIALTLVLMKHDELKNARVLSLGLSAAEVKELQDAGIDVVQNVATIPDLIRVSGLCTADFEALDKLMSKADMNKLLLLKKNAGETVQSFNIVEELDADDLNRNALFAMSPLQVAQSFLRSA